MPATNFYVLKSLGFHILQENADVSKPKNSKEYPDLM
jgi:hypothetical protein